MGKRTWLLGGIALLMVAVVAGRAGRASRDDTGEARSATASATTVRLTPGVTTDSIQVEGRERTFRLYVPSTLPADSAVPLVIGLHGGLGSGEQFAGDTGFDEQAERGGFLVVYPDGIERGRVGLRTWNAGTCCGAAVEAQVDDVAFIEALLDHLEASLPIDASRVFATGHSNGAMMAFRLACEVPHRIAAIAAVAGSLETPCTPSAPVSVLSIHGDADESHPLGGGSGPRALTEVEYVSVAGSLARWRDLNGCTGAAETTVDGALTTSTWAGCRDGTRVVSIIVAGGSHAWPGGRDTGPLRATPSTALDASAAVWAFFAAE